MKWSLGLAAVAFGVCMQVGAQAATTAQAEAATWAWRVLDRYGYKPAPPEKLQGVDVLDGYLDALDPERLVFTQAEADAFEPYREKMRTVADKADLAAPHVIHERYLARLADLTGLAKEYLRMPQDFTGKERYQRVRGKLPRAASEAALRTLWRQRVMDDYLSLRMAGMADADIVAHLERRYDRKLAAAKALGQADIFERYMNAFAQWFDPNGKYYLPQSTLEGGAGGDVGVALAAIGPFVEVARLAPLSAAATQLRLGERIVGVAQPGAPMFDVIGWTPDEVTKLLRGAPGSAVHLEVLPAGAALDAPRRRVSLARIPHGEAGIDCARIETVKPGNVSRRIGILEVPALYLDYERKRAGEKDYRSVTRDAAACLQRFREAQVDAVLLDLRGNTGGSLSEAVEFVGLFIGDGMVLRERSYDGKLTSEFARTGTPAWAGPLTVLVDSGTASGAEIVGAALRDQGRALVLGEPTYGHGTIQVLVSLDRFMKGAGDLRMTTAQFYRIGGTSLEGRGIIPDILLPGAVGVGATSERHGSFPATPLEVPAIDKEDTLAAALPAVAARHAARLVKDGAALRMLQAHPQALALQETGEVSLNEAERRAMEKPVPPHEARTLQLAEALRITADAVAPEQEGAAGGTGAPATRKAARGAARQ